MNKQNPENPTQSDNIALEKPKRVTKNQKKKLMLESLGSQLGIVSIACKQVGIHRDTHYQWMKEDSKYKKDVEDVVYYTKDFLENALLKLVKEGNPMITWNANKTRNRDRGYGEHLDLNHSGDQSITFIEEVLTDEQIKKMKNDKKNPIKPEAK